MEFVLFVSAIMPQRQGSKQKVGGVFDSRSNEVRRRIQQTFGTRYLDTKEQGARFDGTGVKMDRGSHLATGLQIDRTPDARMTNAHHFVAIRKTHQQNC